MIIQILLLPMKYIRITLCTTNHYFFFSLTFCAKNDSHGTKKTFFEKNFHNTLIHTGLAVINRINKLIDTKWRILTFI